jgi:hypothetical protein
MEELPFAVGLQMLHADDMVNGISREWSKKAILKEDVDALSFIEETLSRHAKIQT